MSSTVKQLELLLNNLLLKETSPVPYAFYVNNIEVTNSIMETLVQIQQLKDDAKASNATSKKSEKVDKKSKKDASSTTEGEPPQQENSNEKNDVDNITTAQDFSTFEDTVTISYQPLSVFRVRPVTRCVEVEISSINHR